MKITLTYTGVIDVKNYANGADIEVDDGSSVDQVLGLCGIREQHRRFVIPIVNGKQVRLTHVLADGDDLSLFLPLGGG
jgi:sulfur carrier protein ThiS